MNAKTIFFKDDILPFVEARFSTNSATSYKEHFHKTLSIGAILQGEVSYIYNNQTQTLKQNELALINPFINHSCNPINKSPRSYHMLYVDTDYAKELQKEIFKNVENFIPLKPIKIYDKTIFENFINLNRLLIQKNISYIQKEVFLWEFLTKIFTKYCNQKSTHTPISKSDEIVQKAKFYMEKNIDKNLTIDEIARYVKLSKFYFLKLFKASANTTPHTFLLNLKIHKARNILKNSNSIASIANELGFFDQSHFTKVFKAYTALTPLEYQQSLKK